MRITMPWEHVPPGTPENGVPNLPSPEGEELGFHLRRLLADRLADAPLCGTCAFRPGTLASRSAPTLMSAVKCLMERTPFYCHEGGEPVCAGFATAIKGSK